MEGKLRHLITIIDDINGGNVHQTICSLYDIRNQLNNSLISQLSEHYGIPYQDIEYNEKMNLFQFVTYSLVVIMYCYDNNLIPELNQITSYVIKLIQSKEIVQQYDRLYAKIYFFYSLSAENPLELLLLVYRRSCDSHLHQTQATIVNCILKYYISTGGYTLALSFLKHCNFPNDASPAQLGRFHFFVGHLKAISLEYAEAQYHLQLSLRRLPQNKYAEPFRSLVSRHLMVVMMLQGQVPSRTMLLDLPIYLDLARSILNGDVLAFQEVSQNPQFAEDGLGPLVQRLRSSVILAGLTMISHCYSRISFSDIANMLHIRSDEDAEGFCAKAAADGLIEATIDHDNGYLISVNNNKDETNAGFSERINKDIQDCFGIREDTQRIMHDEAVQE